MNNINGEIICGKCGTAFNGVKCPNCGLVMCKDIINNNEIKLKLVNEAYALLMRMNLVGEGVKLDDSYASFYYMLQSLDREDGDIIAAFKIIGSNVEFYFNYNNTLQCLKPEGREMYEREFNEVRRIHRVTDNELNNPAYKVSVYELKNYSSGVCKNCNSNVNPYDIICNNCQRYLVPDFPNDFKPYTLKVSLSNYANNTQGEYFVTLSVPNNLSLTQSDSNYLTFVNNKGPAFISFRIIPSKGLNPTNLVQYKEEMYLGKQVCSGYQRFQNGDIIYISEVQINNDMYGIMEYQIGDAKTIEQYNEFEFKRYLAILIYANIGGNGYVDNNTTNNYDNNIPSEKKKGDSGLIIGIIIGVLVLLVGGYFAYTKLFSKPTIKIEPYTFQEVLTIDLPSDYEVEDTFNSDSLGWYQANLRKEHCYLSLDKKKAPQKYNYETGKSEDQVYTTEGLVEDGQLEEKTINGKKWYYREKGTIYEYYYIDEKDPRFFYKIELIAADSVYCKINEIINSATIK